MTLNLNEMTTRTAWEYSGGALIVPAREDNLLQYFADPNFAIGINFDFTAQSNFVFLNLKYKDDGNRIVLMFQLGSKYPVIFTVRNGQWQPTNYQWANVLNKPTEVTIGWRWTGNTCFVFRSDYADDVLAYVCNDNYLVAGMAGGVASGNDRYARITSFNGKELYRGRARQGT